MIKIALVTASSDIGGAERAIKNLVDTIDEKTYTFLIVSILASPGAFFQSSKPNRKLHCLGLRRCNLAKSLQLLPTTIHRLSLIFDSYRPDVVHSWMYHANLLSHLALKRTIDHPPHIWSIRCALQDKSRFSRSVRVIRKVLSIYSPQPSVVIANSHEGLTHHIKYGYRPRRSLVIDNGFDCNLFQPNDEIRKRLREQFGLSTKDVLFGCIGRVEPVKDQNNLLEAIKCLQLPSLSSYVLFAGRGTYDLQFAPTPHVLTIGERSDIPDIMRALDILVLPSRCEGFPNVLGEAMASGVPCISTDVGDARRIIGNTGLIVRPQDPRALAKAMVAMVEAGPEHRQRLGKEARERIMSHWSIEACVSRHERLYRALARKRRTMHASRLLNH